MGKTRRQTHKKAKKAQTHKKKAQTHKKKAQTHKKKHTGRKHRRNHTRKMSGGILSRIKRRLRERREKKAIEKDEERKVNDIKKAAAIKEFKKTGYFPEFPPRARLPPGTYDNLNQLNRLKHEYAEAVSPSNAIYASVGPASNASYASVGHPSNVIYDRVKGDSATPYENESFRSRSSSKLVPNPEDVYAVVKKKNHRLLTPPVPEKGLNYKVKPPMVESDF